jgi:hypothetical protein
MARSAGLLWPTHYLLQPFRPVAKGRSMGPDHGFTCRRSGCDRPNDVRVHQHAACIARNRSQSMGRSRGGLTSKIHAVVDTNGLPVRLGLTAGEAHDNRLALSLLSRLRSGSELPRLHPLASLRLWPRVYEFTACLFPIDQRNRSTSGNPRSHSRGHLHRRA